MRLPYMADSGTRGWRGKREPSPRRLVVEIPASLHRAVYRLSVVRKRQGRREDNGFRAALSDALRADGED